MRTGLIHKRGFRHLLAAVGLATVLSLWIAPAALAQPGEATPEVAAASFVALLDSGDMAAAWQEFTPVAKAIKNELHWQRLHKTVRSGYGPLDKRTLRGVTRQASYPMLPDGQFAIVQFNASFLHKQTTIETLVLALGADGQWRVHDYVIN